MAYVVPSIVLAASLPMILGKVGPNHMYGFRTPKTLRSPEVWYPANRAAGWFTAVGAAIALAFNLALWWTAPDWPPEKTMRWMMGGNLVPLSVALALSFICLRRL